MAEYRRSTKVVPCVTDLDPPIWVRDLGRSALRTFGEKMEALLKQDDLDPGATDQLIASTFACDADGESFDNFATVDGWMELGLDERDEIILAIVETRDSLGKRMEKFNETLPKSSPDASDSTGETPTTSQEPNSDKS